MSQSLSQFTIACACYLNVLLLVEVGTMAVIHGRNRMTSRHLGSMLLAFVLMLCQAVAQTNGQVHRENVSIHYQVFGKGYPIALLSGGPGAPPSVVMPIAKGLEKHYQVILIDQRGTGKSKLDVVDSTTITLEHYVEDVESVRRHLGIDQWILMGFSWGGGLSMAVTATYPQHSAGMILIGSIGIDLEYRQYAYDSLRIKRTEDERSALEYWSDPQRQQDNPERAAYETYRAILPSRLYDRSDMHPILDNFVVETEFSVIAKLMSKHLKNIDYDLRQPLSKYEGPVLIVQGRQGFLGGRTAAKILETIPNAQIDYIEKCGHFPFVEQPEEFFVSVNGFLGDNFPVTQRE